MKSLILTISCSDKPGIVAEVTKFLFKNGFNILESGQFNDKYTDNFFITTGNAGNILVLIDSNVKGRIGDVGEVVDSFVIDKNFKN